MRVPGPLTAITGAIDMVHTPSSTLAVDTRLSDHRMGGGVLASLFEESKMCMVRADSRLRVIEANADFSRRFGWPSGTPSGSHFGQFLHPDGRDGVGRRIAGLAEDRLTGFTERVVVFQRKDTTTFDGELTGIAAPWQVDPAGGFVFIVRPEQDSGAARRPHGRKPTLTGIEARVLEGVAAGRPTVQLASMLFLSRGGIEYHVNAMLRRLKVNNRPALVAKAYSTGLLCLGSPPRVHPERLT